MGCENVELFLREPLGPAEGWPQVLSERSVGEIPLPAGNCQADNLSSDHNFTSRNLYNLLRIKEFSEA